MTTCPYCRIDIEDAESRKACTGCPASYHPDCWDESGGCAVVGCAANPATPVAPSPVGAFPPGGMAPPPLPPPPPAGSTWAPPPPPPPPPPSGSPHVPGSPAVGSQDDRPVQPATGPLSARVDPMDPAPMSHPLQQPDYPYALAPLSGGAPAGVDRTRSNTRNWLIAGGLTAVALFASFMIVANLDGGTGSNSNGGSTGTGSSGGSRNTVTTAESRNGYCNQSRWYQDPDCGAGGVNSDRSDGYCNSSRYLQDPDCGSSSSRSSGGVNSDRSDGYCNTSRYLQDPDC